MSDKLKVVGLDEDGNYLTNEPTFKIPEGWKIMQLKLPPRPDLKDLMGLPRVEPKGTVCWGTPEDWDDWSEQHKKVGIQFMDELRQFDPADSTREAVDADEKAYNDLVGGEDKLHIKEYPTGYED